MIKIVTAPGRAKVWEDIRSVITSCPDILLVGESEDPSKALGMVEHLHPNILLLGLDMPDLDSFEVARVLRAAGGRTRAVAITATNAEYEILRAIRLGCSGIVPSESVAETLIECLEKVHSGDTWLDPAATSILVRQFVSPKPVSQSHDEVAGLTRDQREIVLAMGALIRRAREAEEASRAKSRFLSNMSHQLRTLLNATIGFSELALEESVGPLNAKQREIFTDNLNCSRQLRGVINDLLDLAKVEAGKMEVVAEPIDPASLLRTEVIDVQKGVALRKQVTLDLSGNIGEIVGDSCKLKHIVNNLVSNAIKFSPDEGRVAVRISKCSPNEFKVEVSDQGPGIGSDKISLLFNRFQQLDSHHNSAGGSGLGLALSKELAELMGGKVGVESVPGLGSVFYVVLPVRVQPKCQEAHELQLDVSRPRILVVEDESSERLFLRKALARVGYRVDVAAHLMDAKKKCQRTRYDAITLDLALGADDGTDLLKDANSRNHETPVIVISNGLDAVRHCPGRIRAQLHKPIKAEALFNTLTSVGVPPQEDGRTRQLLEAALHAATHPEQFAMSKGQ